MQIDIPSIENKIGYVFTNKQLLYNAFVHSSFAKTEKVSDNERMEFFGDAVLEYVVSEYLYKRYPYSSVKQLTKMRAAVVSADGLRPVVDGLDILKYLVVSNNADFVKTSQKIEANLYEALLCAIYLDGGLPAAEKFVLNTLKNSLNNVKENMHADPKTAVHEYCQANKKSVEYRLDSRTGPDHSPKFVCSLWIDGKKVSDGTGKTIKLAEKAAASKIVREWRID